MGPDLRVKLPIFISEYPEAENFDIVLSNGDKLLVIFAPGRIATN